MLLGAARRASRGERASPGLSPAEREEELAMRHRFLAARESELEAERQRAGALEAELVSLRAATPAEIADLVKENTELRKRLTACSGSECAERGQGPLDGELERLRREVTALRDQSRQPRGPETQDYARMKEELEVQAQKSAHAEIEDAQRRFSVMASAMRNQIEAESKCADELRAALAAAQGEPAPQESQQGPRPVTSNAHHESLLEHQLMKQAEALSLKDSRIAELEEEVTILKRKGNLLRLAPGVAQGHDRTPSFAESLPGAEEELPEEAPAWLREEEAGGSATGEKL